MKEKFLTRKFKPESLALIRQADNIIREYQADTIIMTLRMLYYQCVSRAILENTVNNYKRLGSIINDARYAGLIDWSVLEDKTRGATANAHWSSPASVIRSAAYSFSLDKWVGQKYRVEVWVEKEALSTVIQPVASANDVPFLACRGYLSATEMYNAAQRARDWQENYGQETVIIYLGDHDPSGLDMSQSDIPKRYEIFLDKYDLPPAEVRRIALNFDQILKHKPPPNPAKETDTRFQAYAAEHGDSSWELDALEPRTLRALIQTEIDTLKDKKLFRQREEEERRQSRVLDLTAENWDAVAKYVEKTF